MLDVLYIEEVDQAATLLRPRRVDLVQRLNRPRTCSELGAEIGETPQKVYYHIKELQRASLVDEVGTRRVRGLTERWYQARARSYWLAPQVIQAIGGDTVSRDQVSLRYLLSLAEEIQRDVGRLAMRVGIEIPSFAVSAQVRLPDEHRRAAFMTDVQRLFEELLRDYGLPATTDTDGSSSSVDSPEASASWSATFRLALTCYPILPTNGGSDE